MRLLLNLTCLKLKIMFSDKIFFSAMIIIPVCIMLATGYALRYEKLGIIPVTIVDEDNSGYSKMLLSRFSAKESFKVDITDREKAIDNIKGNKSEVAFIVKKGFENKIKSNQTSDLIETIKSPSSFSFSFISEVFAGEVMRFITSDYAVNKIKKEYINFNSTNETEIIEYIDSLWIPKPLLTITYKEIEGNGLKEVKRVSPPAATATSYGIIVVFIMFYILFNSSWLIDERVNGTLTRIASAYKGFGYIFVSNIIAMFSCATLQIALFQLVIKIFYRIDLFVSVWSYGVIASYVVAVISLSLFLSAVLKTSEQIQSAAPFFAIITSFVGGCFWNFVEMPQNLQKLSMLTLQGWALRGINSSLLNQPNTMYIIAPIIVMLTVSTILIPLSYVLINKKVH